MGADVAVGVGEGLVEVFRDASGAGAGAGAGHVLPLAEEVEGELFIVGASDGAVGIHRRPWGFRSRGF